MIMEDRNFNTHIAKDLTKLESYHAFTTPTGFGAAFLAIFTSQDLEMK